MPIYYPIDWNLPWHKMEDELPKEQMVSFITKEEQALNYGWACPARGCIRLRNGQIHFSEVEYWIEFNEEIKH